MFLPTFNMPFFNTTVPILSRKPKNINFQNYPGVWLVKYQLGKDRIYSTFYTRLDQACIVWGLISVAIFAVAQFFPINWGLQALLWSFLSLIGTLAMVDLTGSSAKEEPFKFILNCWVILMLGGLILTDLSIFLGWGEVLLYLCPLWLGLNALGYLCTAIAMRSRTFLVTSLIHLLSIFMLPYVGQWQFLTTGLVIGLSVLILAEFQWDTATSCIGNPVDNSTVLNPAPQDFHTHQLVSQ